MHFSNRAKSAIVTTALALWLSAAPDAVDAKNAHQKPVRSHRVKELTQRQINQYLKGCVKCEERYAKTHGLAELQTVKDIIKAYEKGVLIADPARTHPKNPQTYALSDQIGAELMSVSTNSSAQIAMEQEAYRMSRPEVYRFLNMLGSALYQETGEILQVNGLTRSMLYQRRLRRVNGNAALGFSSHTVANAVDISHKDMSPQGQRLLDRILAEGERSGHWYVTKEKHSACYHVALKIQGFKPHQAKGVSRQKPNSKAPKPKTEQKPDKRIVIAKAR